MLGRYNSEIREDGRKIAGLIIDSGREGWLRRMTVRGMTRLAR